LEELILVQIDFIGEGIINDLLDVFGLITKGIIHRSDEVQAH